MISVWKKICITAILLTASGNLAAQTKYYETQGELSKVLLRKDLRQAIKEAERFPANDLRSLLWRLGLYQRAAHQVKVTSTVRQVLAVADTAQSRYALSEHVLPALKDPLFTDAETLQLYLQFDFNDDVYGKLVDLCVKNRESCDVGNFDKWLDQKVQETSDTKSKDKHFYGENTHWNWLARRIDWRERFGLDNGLILNQFAEEVRENPTDLDAALRYLKFNTSLQSITWLAETFASKQAYDYYELGSNLYNITRAPLPPQNDYAQIGQISERFLQKSLSLPFNAKDKDLMWSQRSMFTSVPPVIKNHEKQLRFWTKTELAEVLKNLGRPQDAQPIVEELMNLDMSDIVSYRPSELAGAVQLASGARAVESKILVDEATRRTSYEYWHERVAYYRGRKEPERVFDAYLQSFAAVPFDLSNKGSGEGRLSNIRRFADFGEDEYGYYGNASNSADFSDEEKQKLRMWSEAENSLRNEFERTKSNVSYSYKLTEIIAEKRFDKLSYEILSRNPELLVKAAQNDLIDDLDSSVNTYFKLDNVTLEKKNSIADQIIKIAEKKRVEKAWLICGVLNDIEEHPNFARRIVPILEKNLQIAENKFSLSKNSDDNYQELEGLKNKYIEILFETYLSANDWKSAEKLLMKDFTRLYSSPFDSLAINAAKNGAFDDAVRYWKLKSNLDRRNLENLSSLIKFTSVVEALRQFYRQMKTDEPYSPVPDIALDILK